MTEILLAVPNVSVGSDPSVVAAITLAYESGGVTVLDVHTDNDHGRTVHTLAGSSETLPGALVAGYEAVKGLVTLEPNQGVHPRAGLLDVAPIVFRGSEQRGPACAAALATAGGLGRAGAPVFLYGLLGDGRTRAEIRRGGPEELAARVSQGELVPDFGPSCVDPSVGAVMVAARAPLVAFNLRLADGESLEAARQTAAIIREGGSAGLVGVRALGLDLVSQGYIQLSMNLENPDSVGIPEVVEAVAARHAIVSGELIGLAEQSVIDSISAELPMPGLDPDLHSIEGSLMFHGVTN
ncbi:MAG: hypothetical protein NTY57_00400 [Solirubrobacterales bacterium]|nr:hypothetical protein [Solirubrobacterales bacterium]